MSESCSCKGSSSLKRGDLVMVIAGGNKKIRQVKGQVGKILRFAGCSRDKVVIEGLNLVTRHYRAKGANKPAAKIQKEAPIHISRVMFYVEAIKRPVRICHQYLSDGAKVRGYKDPQSGEFVQISN